MAAVDDVLFLSYKITRYVQENPAPAKPVLPIAKIAEVFHSVIFEQDNPAVVACTVSTDDKKRILRTAFTDADAGWSKKAVQDSIKAALGPRVDIDWDFRRQQKVVDAFTEYLMDVVAVALLSNGRYVVAGNVNQRKRSSSYGVETCGWQRASVQAALQAVRARFPDLGASSFSVIQSRNTGHRDFKKYGGQHAEMQIVKYAEQNHVSVRFLGNSTKPPCSRCAKVLQDAGIIHDHVRWGKVENKDTENWTGPGDIEVESFLEE
mmetsp:Transcript_23648/g.40675  ORF Transcript_23648/g.40675 Transcript_23648/m.40675 type:complete len:264 (+) Transcript_23648:100-891(+)|eukprot:CAMPEP_0196652682 /NCGR_PEP_ID=MMETSP1086-20130531/2026_1 /TAXON_ID=77921 /ORGANISM="Cyanoptyche  gloeocystis , Strain SAG4.97" /LENGTH=263 /DNA_ID=CAMNT_0041983349 /DNA_START=233 /DNA_END=1024 /DNA_ORIENTATION=-